MAEIRFGRKSLDELNGLLDRLASSDPAIRSEANRETEKISVQDVIRTLEASYSHTPRAFKGTTALVGLGVGSLVFLAAFWSWHLLAACFFAALGAVVGISCTLAIIMPSFRQRILITIAERMQEVSDVRDLGMVLDFIDGSYIPSRKASMPAFSQYPVSLKNSLRSALARLLPQVNRPTYMALSKSQRESFCYVLEEPYLDTEFTLALIQTIGELDDLKHWNLRLKIQAFAREAAPTENMKRVRVAAAAALARIQERCANEKEAHTLLRGSSLQQSVQMESLLRPVANSGNPSEGQLLRAANSDTAEA